MGPARSTARHVENVTGAGSAGCLLAVVTTKTDLRADQGEVDLV